LLEEKRKSVLFRGKSGTEFSMWLQSCSSRPFNYAKFNLGRRTKELYIYIYRNLFQENLICGPNCATILPRGRHSYMESLCFIPFKALLSYFNHFVPTHSKQEGFLLSPVLNINNMQIHLEFLLLPGLVMISLLRVQFVHLLQLSFLFAI
jgi:hypothetical protein